LIRLGNRRPLFLPSGRNQSRSPDGCQNNLRGTFVLEGANASLEVFFTLTPENPPLIQEFHLRETEKRISPLWGFEKVGPAQIGCSDLHGY
jgi:hypothetical protein